MITTTCWILWIPAGVSTTGADVGLRIELDDPFDEPVGDAVEVEPAADVDVAPEVEAEPDVDDVDDVDDEFDVVVDAGGSDVEDVFDDVEHAAKITATALADTINFVRVLITASLFAPIVNSECDQNMIAAASPRMSLGRAFGRPLSCG